MKNRRYGMNTFLFASPFTNDRVDLFPKFKSWGFDSVEIAIEDPSHLDPVLVKSALDDAELVCGSVCACMGPDRDLRGTKAQNETAKSYLQAVLTQMQTLDCPKLVGPVYSSVGRADAVSSSDYQLQWATVVNSLQALCQQAEDHGQEICLEPLNRFETDFINTCAQGINMINDVASPSLKLHLDTFHMNIEEKNLGAAIRQAGPLLRHFHACASDRGTPGNDHMDWEEIRQALDEVNYQGDLVIESFTQEVKVIARAAAIWRKIEPSNESIAVDGLHFLQRIQGDMPVSLR